MQWCSSVVLCLERNLFIEERKKIVQSHFFWGEIKTLKIEWWRWKGEPTRCDLIVHVISLSLTGFFFFFNLMLTSILATIS